MAVAMNASNPHEYTKLMQSPGEAGFQDVCSFIVNLVDARVKVIGTAVAAPGVDVKAVRELALALGAVDFKARPYFSA